MFKICKCNLFHFLYANAVSLLLTKPTRISGDREVVLTTLVSYRIITVRQERTKDPDKFLLGLFRASILHR